VYSDRFLSYLSQRVAPRLELLFVDFTACIPFAEYREGAVGTGGLFARFRL
jgi:hypothetical protein